jgi:hypothetical protein
VSASIYALTDPVTGEIRYIGKANDVQIRFKQHIRAAKKKSTPLYRWVNDLLDAGATPNVIVLETCDDWEEAEQRLIAKHRIGGRLLNVAEGGQQGYCPPEICAANGRANAKKRDKRKWALMQKLGSALKRGHVSEVTKTKMRSRPDVFGQFAAYL